MSIASRYKFVVSFCRFLVPTRVPVHPSTRQRLWSQLEWLPFECVVCKVRGVLEAATRILDDLVLNGESDVVL